VRKKRRFTRHRLKRPRRSLKHPGYKLALEILIIAAFIEGAFFLINSYKKPKPLAPAAKIAKPAVVKPAVAKVKLAPKIEPQSTKVKPKPEIKPNSQPQTLPAPEEIKPKPEPEDIVKKPPPPIKKKIIPPGSEAKIAIVIDDWGYSLNNLRVVDEIKYPFTAAVLPNLRYSQEAAAQLHNRGKEVILHLPMESESKLGMEKDTIMVSMDEGQIKNIVEQDLNNVGYAGGINNHMGSKATGDPRVMEEVFKELRKRRLYFLDSAVTPKSVCLELAKKMKVAFIERDIFLDNSLEPEYIKGQLEKLKAIAKKNGFAVGIGHDRKNTLEVLKETMPQLQDEGYKFVFVSELLSHQ